MKASLQKETRLLLPAWGLALAAAVIPACLPSSSPAGIALPCFAVGALLLALAPFGQEISLGTFSLLLSQPQTRRRLWRTKLTSVALAMLSVWGVLAILWVARTNGSPVGWNLVEDCALAALVALTGALWTTLLFRQNIAAFWASLLIPWLLCSLWPAPWDPKLETTPARALALPLLVYAAAGFAFARWLLLRAQDLPWTGGIVSLARLRPGTWSFSLLTPQERLRPWLALLQKEIALQQVTLFLVPCLAVLHLLAIGARVLNPLLARNSNSVNSVWVLWLAVPFVMGSVAVAEERRLNTMTGVLCLPARRFKQFLIKFIFILVAGVILGAAVPWLLEDLGQFFGARNELLNWAGRPSLLLAAGAIALVSFFASSLARDSLRALGIGFVLSVAVFAYICGNGFPYTMDAVYLGNPLLRASFLPVTLAALICPAYANFRRIDLHSACLSSLIKWLATVIILLGTAFGVYFRPWELLMTLEPPHVSIHHGSLQRVPSSLPRICATFERIYILRPFGGLWECRIPNHKEEENPEVRGQLLPGGKWVDIATDFAGALAIRSNGSLWDVSAQRFGILKPEQVGVDSDWMAVAGGSLLSAIKQDGSLWRLNRETLQMERLGEEYGWVKIFGLDGYRLIAIQQDGEVWAWSQERDRFQRVLQHGFKGTNWVSFTSEGPAILGLDTAGNILRVCARSYVGGKRATDWLVDGKRPTDWRALAGNWAGFGFVDTSRRLWRQTSRWGMPFWASGEPQRTSKYSDWIAVTAHNGSLIALTENGFISSWQLAAQWETETSLLAPTRKPEWSGYAY